jgi:hypothetical protein
MVIFMVIGSSVHPIKIVLFDLVEKAAAANAPGDRGRYQIL